MMNYFKKINDQTCARHINGEFRDLYDFKIADWINDNNLKKINIENFEGSRNIKFIISDDNLLLIKYNNILLGNLYLLFQCTYQTETFWIELNTNKKNFI